MSIVQRRNQTIRTIRSAAARHEGLGSLQGTGWIYKYRGVLYLDGPGPVLTILPRQRRVRRGRTDMALSTLVP